MEFVFIRLLNMSITASYVVIAVILLRFILRKAPKKLFCLLWGVVAFRLVCPFSFKSVLSLIPSTTTLSPEIMYSGTPQINSGIDALNRVVNPILSNTFTPDAAASVSPVQAVMFIGSIIWIVGMTALLLYSVFTMLRLKGKVAAAIPYQDNIYQCDQILSPFVLGLFRPRVYIPFRIDEAQVPLVIVHEKAHISHRDHWIKPFGFLLLSVYWFNPLIWIAYILFCRDIELACDERVISEIGTEAKKSYSNALLDCSVKHTSITMCPLAFGEVGVKQRVKNILHYKKPAFGVVVVALLAILVLSLVLLTNPINNFSNPTPATIYRLQDDDSVVPASIVLFEDDKFQFTTSPLSSYLNIGTYKIEDNRIIMETDDGLYNYTFLLEGGNLVFQEAESSVPARFENERKIVDGDIFIGSEN